MIAIETILSEYKKSYEDKTRIYMIENYLTTQDATQGGFVPFLLFPRQKEFLTNMTIYQGNITLKPRQTGFSTVTCAKIACEMILANENNPISILVLAQNHTKAKDNTKLIRDFIIQCPRWFFGSDFYSPDPNDPKNKKKIFKQDKQDELTLFNGSKIFARSSKVGASNGIPSVSILFCDEAAYFADGKSVFMEALATTSAVPNKLIIMVSTPNGKDELYYPYYQSSLENKNKFKVLGTRWYDDPRYNQNLKFYKEVKKKRENNEEYIDTEWIIEETIDKQGNVLWQPEKWLTLEKEGWKAVSPWYINACEEKNNDKQYIAQSLECSFVGSDAIALDPEIIEMQRVKNVSDIYKTDPLQSNTWIWKPPIPGHRYMMGIDGSRGDAGDNATIEIFDIDAIDEEGNKYIEQTLEYIGKMAGDLIGELAYKYGLLYNNAFCVVDCIGGYGEAAVLTMLRLEYPNLYYDNINGKDYLIDTNLSSFQPNEEGKLPGFHAKGARTFMIDGFITKLRNNVFKVRSIRLINELETWIVNSNGKIEHKSGKHDDTLTNLSMSLFVYDNNFLKMTKQKEKDEILMLAWINSLKNPIKQTINNETTKYINPDKYNDLKIYNYNNLPNNNNKFPHMWVLGNSFKKSNYF